MDFAKIDAKEIFFKYFREYSDVILKIQPKIGHLLTLKANLARFRCGTKLVDGMLKHQWVDLSNSKIKSGGWSSGFCRI